ncbi:MAG TPA: nucleotidyltransferase family protein [Terriglobales bacterium]|nr:nucleotidyltransferase family protein [Terriglobales bacterium]
MNHQLAAGILNVFRDDAFCDPAPLRQFPAREWSRTEFWLDASGLALYFLNRLENLHATSCIPPQVLNKLESKRKGSAKRAAVQLQELESLTNLLQERAIPFVVMKGFTLIPDYCPDATLRYQLDLDFLVPEIDAQICRHALRRLRFELTDHTTEVWQFKRGSSRLPGLPDLYRPQRQSTVELHFSVRGAYGPEITPYLIDRTVLRSVKGFVIPSLSDVDLFIAQAAHLFGHIRSEWTRASWLLEFRNFVAGRRNDEDLWSRVTTAVADRDDLRTAVGCALEAATRAWGEFAPPELTEWFCRYLNPGVRRWCEDYTPHILHAEFPGTKFYLILERELGQDTGAWKRLRRAKLLPLRKPPKVIPQGAAFGKESASARTLAELRYVLFRARFHIQQGIRTAWHLRKWQAKRPSVQVNRCLSESIKVAD